MNDNQNSVGDGRLGGPMVAERGEVADVAISGERTVATNGEAGEGTKNTVVAISGYKAASRTNAKRKVESKIEATNLRMFPTAISGNLFGLAKAGLSWRKPRRKTKPGNPRVAADGYEWRKAPTGDSWVLWHRPYLSNGKRGPAKYVAVYALDSVKQLERLYGKREISKSKRPPRHRGVDSGRGADSDAGQQNANFG
jgi:hypothetical protein